jgi:hypothetical protein
MGRSTRLSLLVLVVLAVLALSAYGVLAAPGITLGGLSDNSQASAFGSAARQGGVYVEGQLAAPAADESAQPSGAFGLPHLDDAQTEHPDKAKIEHLDDAGSAPSGHEHYNDPAGDGGGCGEPHTPVDEG